MFDKFTNRAKQVVKLAKKEAQKLNHNYLGTEHLLLGLLKLGQGIAVNVLKNVSVEYDAVISEIENIVGFGPEIQVYGEPTLTGKVKKAFEYANEEASFLHHNYVGTEHLLLGLMRQEDGVAITLLKNLSVTPDLIKKEVLKELETFNLQLPPLAASHSHASSKNSDRNSSDKTPALKAYGYDMTEKCVQGELDPVIGRSQEVEQLILILCRRRKNNPVLVGEAGVGKTAIVEGLAHAITNGKVPETIANKKLISLDLTLMVAGTKYRGQFEERIKAVMEEVKTQGNILLFIDEIHTIVGAGSAEGAIDASNILKPALARGEIQCIGATTLDEFRKQIEKDAALERRFQKIHVNPPSISESISILYGLQEKYEEHHHCNYTDEAINAAVVLSDRYIAGRFLPDKAIDLIDEAGAKARISVMHQPEEIITVEKNIVDIRKQKEDAIVKQEYEKAARFRDKEKQLLLALDLLQADWKEQKSQHQVVVGYDDIAEIVAKITGVPTQKITQEESQKVLAMQDLLQTVVVGQESAVESVCKAVQRSRADIKDPKRPIGTFLFLGPTGVGKTLLARMIATHLFGGEDSLIQVDMSEYMEKFSVSRLTGSPPGYVGYDEGGQLTEKVRRRPYSVVLFDEIEKAHPDVMNLLLQILEEGRLTDSFGRHIDFKNTIIILTSNLGSDLIKKASQIGFGAKDGIIDHASMEQEIKRTVHKQLRPELVNRLDDLVIFRALAESTLIKVIDLEIRKLKIRLEAKNLTLNVSKKAKEFIAKKGYKPEMGARPIRRSIQKYLEDPLAEMLLKENDEKATYIVDAKIDSLSIKKKKKKE